MKTFDEELREILTWNKIQYTDRSIFDKDLPNAIKALIKKHQPESLSLPSKFMSFREIKSDGSHMVDEDYVGLHEKFGYNQALKDSDKAYGLEDKDGDI